MTKPPLRPRPPFVAVRNHWDPRSGASPWLAYRSEVTKDFEDGIMEGSVGTGKGFHECLNFAFEHPDNVPELHLYLPPNLHPDRKKTETSNLLVFVFTYKGGNQGQYPGHLVAVVGAATYVSAGGMVRKHAGNLYGRKLHWSLAANPEDACVLVEPLPMKKLHIPSLTRQTWGEGLRYLSPAEALSLLDTVRDTTGGYATHSDTKARAAADRQARVAGRLLGHYAPYWTAPPSGLPSTTAGRGGSPLVPDDEAGRKAEEMVFRRELAEVRNLLKKHRRAEHAEQLVFWWRDHGKDHEPYDIESARIDENGQLVKAFIEVKSSRARDFSTVRISERQMECARNRIAGQRHYFVFVRTTADGTPDPNSIRYYDESDVQPWLEPVGWRVHGPRWAASDGNL